MIPIRVSVEYDVELTRFEKNIAELPARLRNLRPVMEQGVAPATNRMLKRHWDSKGAAFKKKWAPLAWETIRKRERHGTLAKGILRDSDHLFRSIFRASSAGNIRAIPGGVRLSVSSAESKAALHQVGTQHMPAREVIPDPLPASFRKEVTSIIRTYLRTGNVP